MLGSLNNTFRVPGITHLLIIGINCNYCVRTSCQTGGSCSSHSALLSFFHNDRINMNISIPRPPINAPSPHPPCAVAPESASVAKAIDLSIFVLMEWRMREWREMERLGNLHPPGDLEPYLTCCAAVLSCPVLCCAVLRDETIRCSERKAR